MMVTFQFLNIVYQVLFLLWNMILKINIHNYKLKEIQNPLLFLKWTNIRKLTVIYVVIVYNSFKNISIKMDSKFTHKEINCKECLNWWKDRVKTCMMK